MVRPHLRAWPTLLLAACDGRGARAAGEAANGFAEAMEVVAVGLLVLTAIGAGVYVAIWWWWFAGWRRDRAPWAAAGLLVAIHAAALLLAGDELEVHRWLWWTAPVPAVALALACAARGSLRVVVGVAATAGLCLLPAEPPPLRALPGAIVDLSSSFSHACVVLRGGELVCSGGVADACGDRLTALRRGPTRVEGVVDGERVYTAAGVRCVGHRSGTVSCCGGPSPPANAMGPWSLPGDRPVSALVLTDEQILARTGDELRAWPHPLPAGLRTARAVAASDSSHVRFAVVDRDGGLWMWQQDGAAARDLVRHEGLADAEEVAVQARTGACVRRSGGDVTCFRWPGRDEPRFERPGLGAVQLVALDDPYDSFCVRTGAGAVVCWTEDAAPVPFAALPTATRLVSTHSALCDVAARVRCVPVSHELDSSLVELLALPVMPAR